MTATEPGKLIVLSGPAGVGKSTVVKRLLDQFGDSLRLSVSATTRPPREGEIDGKDYHFLAPEEFERREQQGEFIEACEVFGLGFWYGTPLSEVTPSLEAGKSVILEIDVEGARKALEAFPEAVSIFFRPRSLEELERRLRRRGTESEATIRRRLEVASSELEQSSLYQHQVVSDTVEQSVREIAAIIKQSGG